MATTSGTQEIGTSAQCLVVEDREIDRHFVLIKKAKKWKILYVKVNSV